MAAILMVELLPAHADRTLATWDQNVVSLREFQLEQAIKRIGNLDLK
jgi:hypothetical protein